MKYIYTTLLLSVAIIAKANHTPTLFNKLNSINTCWSEQKDVQHLPIYDSKYTAHSDKQLIQQHLQLVEHVLRNRNTETLTHLQKENRIKNLNNLHQYWLSNNYPINTKTANRTPVFIDDYNTFCAVGYLIKTSGHEPLARKIAKTNNLSYIREMRIADLNQWASNCGLTLDELAWIQPTYIFETKARPLGKGVNGTVYALAGDSSNKKVYAAGTFTLADSILSCNNIVAINYNPNDISKNTFTALSDGLNGTVYALFKDENVLYAGGHFDHSGTSPMNNIAKWDGTTWQAMGQLNGTVKAISKYKGNIYAGGEFQFTYNSQTYQNVAYWDGLIWRPICNQINGTVNALTVYNNRLIVGGAFTTVDTMTVNHIFGYDETSINRLMNGVTATVRTLDTEDGTNPILHAGGDLKLNETDTNWFGIRSYMDGWGWQRNVFTANPEEVPMKNVNCISRQLVAGKLDTSSINFCLNTAFYNGFGLNPFAGMERGGEAFAILWIGKLVFYAGSFNTISCDIPSVANWVIPANNIAIWGPDNLGIHDREQPNSNFFISPNPTQNSTLIQSKSSIKSVSIYDANGKLIWENTLSNYQKELNIERSLFPTSGLYFVTLQTETGQVENQKLLVD